MGRIFVYRHQVCYSLVVIMIRRATAQDVPALRAFQKQFYGEWFDSYHADIVQAVISGFVWVAELDW